MVSNTPSTAAARHLMLGTDDQSVAAVSPEAKSFAQHVPLFLMNTVKGSYDRRHITSNEFAPIYGVESLIATSKHFSKFNILPKTLLPHTTSVIQRLPGKVKEGENSGYRDAKRASLVLCVVTTNHHAGKRYIRDDTTGKITTGEEGQRLTDDNKDMDYVNMGLAVRKVTEGESLDVVTLKDIDGRVVTFTPIKILKAEGHGAWYNKIGFNIKPNIGANTNKDVVNTHKTVTYDFTLYDKNGSKPKKVKTVYGEDNIEFSLNPTAVMPITNKSLLLSDRVPAEYGNFTDPDLPLQSTILDASEDYDIPYNNLLKIETELQTSLNREIRAISINEAGDAVIYPTWVDYTSPKTIDVSESSDISEKEKYLINMVTCMNTKGVGYETIRPFEASTIAAVKESDSSFTFVPTSNNTVTYLANGEDSDKTFLNDTAAMERLFIDEIARYSDSYDVVQSIALNKDTVFYDPGLTMETKTKMGAYISKKKNTFMGISTSVLGEKAVNISTHISRAVAIKSILALNVESAYFNTPTARAFIVIGDGVMKDGSYKPRVPLLLDYATKIAKYTAALSGKWNSNFDFYSQLKSNNFVDLLKDVEPKYIPDPIKDKLFLSGAIWPDNEDELTFFYPINQTIYPEATSILNSVVTAVCISTLNTVNDGIWRTYAGAKGLTPLELKLAVEEDFRESTKDMFDNSFVLKPEVYYTKRDLQLGWIYRLRVHIYATVTNSVAVTHLVAHNMRDLG